MLVEVATAINTFASGETAAAQARVLSELMKTKRLHQASKEPGFTQGLERLAHFAGDAGTDRLTAIAALSRIAVLVKPLQEQIATLLTTPLANPLPPLVDAPDPDDRYYVALLWRHATPPWLARYLATGAVDEESSERVRAACIEGVLEVTSTLASTLAELAGPLRRLSFTTGKRGDSKAKRVRRVLEALRRSYSSSAKSLGDEAGERFRAILIDTFIQDGLPTNNELLGDLAEEALKLIHELLRTRFALATVPETYAALDVTRGWYRDGSWSSFAETSAAARQLVEDLTAALEILVRAGVTNDALYRCLATAAGDESSARRIATALLDRLPGLPDEVSQWLSGQPARKRSAFAAESQLRSFDEALGDLIIAAERLGEASERIVDNALPEIRVLSPQAASQVDGFLGIARSTANAIDAVAKTRGLGMRGQRGESVEFSPLEHELVDGGMPGTRHVRIVKPAVEAPGLSGGRRILRKALVERIE